MEDRLAADRREADRPVAAVDHPVVVDHPAAVVEGDHPGAAAHRVAEGDHPAAAVGREVVEAVEAAVVPVAKPPGVCERYHQRLPLPRR